MCNDFECVHDQCGICSYTDQDCEYDEERLLTVYLWGTVLPGTRRGGIS